MITWLEHHFRMKKETLIFWDKGLQQEVIIKTSILREVGNSRFGDVYYQINRNLYLLWDKSFGEYGLEDFQEFKIRIDKRTLSEEDYYDLFGKSKKITIDKNSEFV